MDDICPSDIFFAMKYPKNEAQRVFQRVWVVIEMVSANGFENLFEQDTRLEDYAAAFTEVGLPEVAKIIERVIVVVPSSLRAVENRDALLKTVGQSYDRFKPLFKEFCDITADADETVIRYIQRHRGDFSEYLNALERE